MNRLTSRYDILMKISAERDRQIANYGYNEDLEDGTGPETRWLLPFSPCSATTIEVALRNDYEDYEEDAGKPTWVHLVREEVAEAFAESDPIRLEEELVQLGALVVSWLETLEERKTRSLMSAAANRSQS